MLQKENARGSFPLYLSLSKLLVDKDAETKRR